MPTPEDPGAFLPLTPVAFEILISLADTERHGYAMLQEIEERTGGGMKLRPGTLYRAVDRLVRQGLIEDVEQRPDPDYDDERRRYYRLTRLGHRVATAEAERLQAAVLSARAKKFLRKRL